VDAADFYTGLVAELYAPLRSGTSDPSGYVEFVREHGEPALELGCGDGDPILDLRASGLDVDGVDSSADMLARCATRAAERGLTVTTFCQRMESLDLPRRYASVYVAGGTFTVLPDDDAGLRALQSISAHLRSGGSVLLPLWIPPPTPAAELGTPRVVDQPNGSSISVAVRREDRDEAARTRKSLLRYERRRADGTTETLERTWVIHWYTPAGFAGLAAQAGLELISCVDDETGETATEESTDFVVVLRASAP
jgi:SAM-dependent methyltransferase